MYYANNFTYLWTGKEQKPFNWWTKAFQLMNKSLSIDEQKPFNWWTKAFQLMNKSLSIDEYGSLNLTVDCRWGTVEGFWRHYQWLKRPSTLALQSDYHLFKEGIKPMWEVISALVYGLPFNKWKCYTTCVFCPQYTDCSLNEGNLNWNLKTEKYDNLYECS